MSTACIKNNTPKRKVIIKTRLTDDEKVLFDSRLKLSGLSQSEYIRKAVFESEIKTVVVNQTPITGFNELIAEFGKIGSNLNQIARYLNQDGRYTNLIYKNVQCSLNNLTKLKFELLKIIGDYYGNHKTHCK